MDYADTVRKRKQAQLYGTWSRQVFDVIQVSGAHTQLLVRRPLGCSTTHVQSDPQPTHHLAANNSWFAASGAVDRTAQV